MNIRDKLLALVSPKPVAAEIEGFGTVHLRTLTVGEILEQQTDVVDGDNRPGIARAVCRVLVDESGAQVFDPKNADDLASVLNLPWPFVRAVLEKGNKLNGLEAGPPKP